MYFGGDPTLKFEFCMFFGVLRIFDRWPPPSNDFFLASIFKKKFFEKTILIVHHDLSKVSKYFDSLILLNKHLIDFGSVENVFTGDNLAQAFGTNILIPSESGDKND